MKFSSNTIKIKIIKCLLEFASIDKINCVKPTLRAMWIKMYNVKFLSQIVCEFYY